jgi:glycosyltransferase involved in cell wall biosynthesis
MTQNPFVSVIIPVYNDAERLEKCLTALSSQTYPKHRFEVIVVDNGSADNPAKLQHTFRHVVFLQEPRPGSYGARNKGIQAAKGDILGFTDSDCIPQQDWILNGVNALRNLPDCGLAAGQVQLFFKNPKRPTATEIYESIHAFDQENMVKKYHHGATANLFTYRRVMDNVGLFNPELKSGGDVEWGKRVFAAGYKQVYAENACVLHPARYSLKDIYKKTRRVEGGLYDMGPRSSYGIQAIVKDAMKLLLSLAALMRRCLIGISPFDRIKTVVSKFKYMFLFGFVKIARIVEKRKMTLGSQSKRA